MKSRQTEAPSGGINFGDIYFTIFRHKWLILGFIAAGVLAAVLIFLVQPPVYVSEARLMIQYVQDVRTGTSLGAGTGAGAASESRVKTPDERGDTIINTEVEILTSQNVISEAVSTVSIPRVLRNPKAGSEALQAAVEMVQHGLAVEIPKRSTTIRVTLAHPDKGVAQDLLKEIVSQYVIAHSKAHRGGAKKLVDLEPTYLGNLTNAEQSLHLAKVKAGVVSVENSRRVLEDQMLKIKQDLYNAKAELAEQQAAFEQLARAAGTNAPSTDLAAPEDPNLVARYRGICLSLETMRTKELDLSARLTDENPQLRQTRAQIAELEKTRVELEQKNPRLALARPNVQGGKEAFDSITGQARIASLQAKIRTLEQNLAEVKDGAAANDRAEMEISALQRTKDLKEASYKYFASSVEQNKIDADLAGETAPNIKEIQTPSLASRDTKKLLQSLGIALGVGIFGGIGLAFLIEMFLDQSIRRPTDFQRKVNIPLFVTIPDAKDTNGHARLFPNGGSEGENGGNMAVETWSVEHSLRPYFEALRDRTVMSFGDDPHKPKLVAVSGFAKGAGVTTIASGLAAALSETGDGRVLLVDMTMPQGAAHPFFRGKPGCALPEMLDDASRQKAMVHENLYLASAGAVDSQGHGLVPKKFSELVPRLKTADYDYIIFDMPPLNQTSVTPRLSTLMDLVLLVVESGKTNAELVKQAGTLLSGSKANVSAVLNKRRQYVPESLQQEL